MLLNTNKISHKYALSLHKCNFYRYPYVRKENILNLVSLSFGDVFFTCIENDEVNFLSQRFFAFLLGGLVGVGFLFVFG